MIGHPRLRQRHGDVICYDKTLEVSDQEAKRLDGSVRVEDTYPCNKIATVIWAYIREEVDT